MRFPEAAKSNTTLAFSLGILAAVVLSSWYYIIWPFQKHPQRPSFANDLKAAPAPTAPIAAFKIPSILQQAVKAKPKSSNANNANNAKYLGRVNASIGLVFRADPNQSAKSVGGADFNAKVAVIRETPDREWVYVRNETTKEEGWVRSGNITKELNVVNAPPPTP